MDDRGGHLHLVPSSRDAGKIALVLPIRRQPGHHLVALCDLVLDDVTPRRRFPEDLEGGLDPLPLGWDGERRRTVVDVVFSDQLEAATRPDGPRRPLEEFLPTRETPGSSSVGAVLAIWA